MPNVRGKLVPRPMEYAPEIRVEYIEGGSFTCAEISWQNAAVVTGLRAMFEVKSDEKIAAITITEQGIRAEFTRK